MTSATWWPLVRSERYRSSTLRNTPSFDSAMQQATVRSFLQPVGIKSMRMKGFGTS